MIYKYSVLLALVVHGKSAFGGPVAIRVSAAPFGMEMPLQLIQEAEKALQEKVKEVCGDGRPRSLTNLRIELVAGPANPGSSCATVNPSGALSGDVQPDSTSEPAVRLFCYASYMARGNVFCDR